MSAIAKKKTNTNVRKLAVTAMLSALAAVLMFLEFPIPVLIPSFVKFDFSELPALIAAFVVSPLSGVAVCLVKNLVNLPFSSSGGIGELCNFLIGAAMVLPAGFIYKYKKTRKGAVLACAAGCVAMALASLPVNYFISYPVYFNIFAPENVILDAYRKLNPAVNNLWDALIWFNAPFTFIKGAAVSVITFLIYKPLSNALKKLW